MLNLVRKHFIVDGTYTAESLYKKLFLFVGRIDPETISCMLHTIIVLTQLIIFYNKSILFAVTIVKQFFPPSIETGEFLLGKVKH